MTVESYLDSLDIKKFRDIFVRFRFGINDLSCNKIYGNASNSQCSFCNVIEDECHFLLSCGLYDTLRKKYLARFINENKQGCAYLVRGTDTTLTRYVAMYIFYAFVLRAEHKG